MVNFAIFGAIEPLLGIVSASLPILPPVFLKLRGESVLPGWKTAHSKQSAGKGGRDLSWIDSTFDIQYPQTNHFSRRLDDHTYPLIDFPHVGCRFLASSVQETDRSVPKDPQNTIRVTTDWTIQSHPGAHTP